MTELSRTGDGLVTKFLLWAPWALLLLVVWVFMGVIGGQKENGAAIAELRREMFATGSKVDVLTSRMGRSETDITSIQRTLQWLNRPRNGGEIDIPGLPTMPKHGALGTR